MIQLLAGARVVLATQPVDFRKGAHSLAVLAAEVLAEDPFSGAVIIFRSKRADRVKILLWDTSGLVLICKQLQQNSFRWPPVMNGVMKPSAVEFAALFDGLDWTRVQTARGIHKPTAAAWHSWCDARHARRDARPARRYRGIAPAVAGHHGRTRHGFERAQHGSERARCSAGA